MNSPTLRLTLHEPMSHIVQCCRLLVQWQWHTSWPPFPHVVDIEITSLFSDILVVIEGNTSVICAWCGGENSISLDFPDGDVHVVGEDERHPVVIHEDVVWAGEIVGAELCEDGTRDQTVVCMNIVHLCMGYRKDRIVSPCNV